MKRDPSDPYMPHPTELRLVRVSGGTRPTRPPLGIRMWSDAPEAAVAVLLDPPKDWPASGPGALAEQIPLASTLAEGTLVVVLEQADTRGGAVIRLLRPNVRMARALRATALLARGFVEIRAAVDPTSGQDLVWGTASSA